MTTAAALYLAEPAAAYERRPLLVVDASVVASAIFMEALAESAASTMRARALCAPVLLATEIANVAARKVRQGELTEAAADALLERFESFDIALHEIPVSQTFRLAMRYDLTAYDASYLQLATILGAPLATFDRRLGEAARAHLAGPPPAPDLA
jgi:predicted nucleic acid-binding protein